MFALLSHLSLADVVKGQNIDITTANWKNIIGHGRPVFLRRVFQGCQFVQNSDPYWKEASRMHEHVLFATTECLNDENGKELCEDIQKQLQILFPDTASYTSPSYVIFPANATGVESIIKYSYKNDYSGFTQNYRSFNDHIYENTGEIPTDLPLNRLDDLSVGPFYEAFPHPAIFFYYGGETAQTAYISELAKLANKTYGRMDDIVFGFLDCNKYGEACSRWGRVAPSLEIYDHSTGQHVAIEFKAGAKYQEIQTSVESAVERLKTLKDPIPTPDPPVVKPTEKPTLPVYQNTLKSELEDRSFSDVQTKWNTLYGGKKPAIAQPWTGGDASKCTVGTHDATDRQNAYDNVNFYRYLYGVEDLTEESSYNQGCMEAALVFNNLDSISHEIPANAPCKTDAAVDAAKNSQLSSGPANAWGAVDNFIEDKEDHNRLLGHRRGVLSHVAKKMGVGMTTKKVSNAVNRGFTVLRIDNVGSTDGRTPLGENKFLAFPNPGPFPATLTPRRWHIQADLFAKGSGVDAKDVTVRVIRSDGIEFSVSDVFIDHEANSGDCLIFSIAPKDVELCSKDFSATVQAYIKSKDTAIQYTIAFKDFDAPLAKGVCFYNTNEGGCPEGMSKAGPGNYQQPQSEDQGQTVYVSDDIKLDKDLEANFAKTITFTGPGRIDGTVHIPASRNVQFSDACLTTAKVDIDYSVNETKAGRLSAGIAPKKITINFLKSSDSKYSIENARYHIYEGPNAIIEMQRPDIQQSRGFVLFGYMFYKDEVTSNRLIVSRFYVPTTVDFYGEPYESGLLSFDDLKTYNSTIATRYILYLQWNNYTITYDMLPDILVDYEIDISGSKCYLVYHKDLPKKMRSLKVVTGNNIYMQESRGCDFQIQNIVLENWPDKIKYDSNLPQIFPIPFEPTTRSNGQEFIHLPKSANYYFTNIVGDNIPASIVPYTKPKNTVLGDIPQNDKFDNQGSNTYGTSTNKLKVKFDEPGKGLGLFPKEGSSDIIEVILGSYFDDDIGRTFRLIPMNYKSITVIVDKSVSLTIFPVNCSQITVKSEDGSLIPVNQEVIVEKDISLESTEFKGGIKAGSGSHAQLTNCIVSGPLVIGDSTVSLSGGSIKGDVSMSKALGEGWPKIELSNKASFEASSVAVTINQAAATRTALESEYNILISGLNEQCEAIKESVTLSSDPSYKLECINGDLVASHEVYDPPKDPNIDPDQNTPVNPDQNTPVNPDQTNPDKPDPDTGDKPDQSTQDKPGESNSDSGNGDSGNSQNGKTNPLGPGAIAGIVISVLSVIAIAAGIAFFVLRRKLSNADIDKNSGSSSSASI